jgi:endonuclease/exonuclease/phosphatase family metal-dependent hydrolase
MRFATWNIGCGAKGFHARDPEGIADAIKSQNVDVCCLQEIDRFAARSRHRDFPSFFQEATGYHTVFATSVTFPADSGYPPREYGNLLLSRWPMEEVRVLSLEPSRDARTETPAEMERRTAIVAKVMAPEPFWAITTHLAYSPGNAPSRIRRGQIADLLRGIAEWVPQGETVILGGDFNTSARSAEVEMLRAALQIVSAEVGNTWPLGDGVTAEVDIDHIFSRGVEVTECRKHDYPGLTDHSMVVADFRAGKPGQR